MGLLDELKQQADTLRQKEQVSQEEISQNLLLAHAKLKDALHYWVELFNSLNVIKPPIDRVYYLEGGATRMDNLRQSDYNVNGRRLTIDHKDYIEAIVLRFRCASDQKLVIEKQPDPVVQRMREHLWTNNLKFDLKEIRNERGYVERGIFTLNAEIPVTVTMIGDLENGRIKVVAKNLEKFGEYTNIYDFDEFNKGVLEELGKVIIGKPNNFRTLGRYQESLRTTATRPPRPVAEPEPAPAPAPPQRPAPAADAAADPTKSFLGSIKSILKR
jgi:hypothetical protein